MAVATMHKAKHQSGSGWGGAAPEEEHELSKQGWGVYQPTADLNVADTIPLVPPQEITNALPMSLDANRCVVQSRDTIRQILGGFDRRLMIVIGPCSIHDEKAALEYAERLRVVGDRIADQLFVVMRVYFEKPRTTIGWKGLINDPYLDGTFAIETGIRRARQLLLQINGMGVPAATEMLDPITPQYIADLISWASIGARTTESLARCSCSVTRFKAACMANIRA